MEKVQIKEITEERKQEVIEFIKSSVEMDFDSYLDFFETNKSMMGRIIMDFYRLPYTELHKEFKEKVCVRHKGMGIKNIENWINNELKENCIKAQNDNLEECQHKYKIVRRYNLNDDRVLIIGIPYEILEPGKGRSVKFAYTVEIYKSRTPDLYNKINDKMETFSYDNY